MDRDTVLAQFIAVTNADEIESLHFLEAAGFDVDTAVLLYLGQGRQDRGESEARAQHVAAQDVPAVSLKSSEMESQAVRRPDVVRAERLYDAPAHESAMRFRRVRTAVQDVPFASFQEGGSRGLNTMYQPPDEIMAPGSLDEIKAVAEEQDQWLLLNIQDPTGFESLQLNADLWGDQLIKDIMKGSFQFAQRTLPSEDAEQLVQLYQLQLLPAIIIVDPNTGQKMHEWHGKVDREKFMEDLLPFMETPPSDPIAGSCGYRAKFDLWCASILLVCTSVAIYTGLMLSSTVKQTSFQVPRSAATGAAGVAGVSDEDEHINQAIAASLVNRSSLEVLADAVAQPAVVAEMQSADEANNLQQKGNDCTDVSLFARESGAAMKYEAKLRIPQEPVSSATDTCRIAVQLPHRRLIRTFHKLATVQAVYDYAMLSLSDEDAQRPFDLVQAAPGGNVRADRNSTLMEAGVAGSVLRLLWQ